MSKLKASWKSSPEPDQEEDLLKIIKAPLLNPDEQKQYDALYKQFRNQDIEPTDYQRLVTLLQKMEMAAAMRLEGMQKLAELRNLTIEQLQEQLALDNQQPNA